MCVDVYNLHPEIVDREGPLMMASVYMDKHIGLDSPNFVAFNYRIKDAPTVHRG